RPHERGPEVAVDVVGRRGGEGGGEVDREEPPVLRRGDGHGRRTVGDRQLHRGDARQAGRVPDRRGDRVRAAVEGGGGDAAARPEGAVDARAPADNAAQVAVPVVPGGRGERHRLVVEEARAPCRRGDRHLGQPARGGLAEDDDEVRAVGDGQRLAALVLRGVRGGAGQREVVGAVRG